MVHPKMRPLQGFLLFPKQPVTGCGPEPKMQAFLLLQATLQNYSQPLLYVLETNGVGLGWKAVQISLSLPLIPHLDLT